MTVVGVFEAKNRLSERIRQARVGQSRRGDGATLRTMVEDGRR